MHRENKIKTLKSEEKKGEAYTNAGSLICLK